MDQSIAEYVLCHPCLPTLVNNMAMIEVRDLVFSYNQQLGMTIDHVSFDVP